MTSSHSPGAAVVSRVQANILQQLDLQGKNSTTYLAMDPQLNAKVVLKEVAYKSSAHLTSVTEEAQRLYAVRHHHIAGIQYAADAGGHIFRIVMPYYSKGSLQELMATGPLSINKAIKYTQHVLVALGHAHSRDIIHADVKPSNVLVSDTDHAILADFGQSVVVREDDQLADVPGMYGYAYPPEAVGATSISRQVDVYQAGLLLYRLLNGQKLWHQQIAILKSRNYGFGDIAKGRWPLRDLWLPHIPESLRRVVRKAMHPAPAQRYQTVDQFANALGRVKIGDKRGACQPIETTDGWEWKHGNDSIEYLTLLRQDQKGGMEIACTRKNTDTQRVDNLKTFNRRGVKSQPDAFKHLEERFQQA